MVSEMFWEFLFMMEIDIESLTLKSSEEEHFESLFLSKKESDIKFKVQEKTLPAHKQALIQRCRYFANLFNSNH